MPENIRFDRETHSTDTRLAETPLTHSFNTPRRPERLSDGGAMHPESYSFYFILGRVAALDGAAPAVPDGRAEDPKLLTWFSDRGFQLARPGLLFSIAGMP